jgi:hypothetical protein
MRTTAFGTIVVLTSWIAAPSTQQPPPPANEPAHKIYVVNGCLEGGRESTSAFKLTGAKNVGQAPPSSSAASTAASKPDTVYELQAVSSVGEQGINREQLQSHVGKRVEVTIRPVEVLPAPPSPAAAPGIAAKPEQPAPQRYTAVKISTLAESCVASD